MFENVNLADKSSSKRKNNRKKAKVFDPCICNKKKKTADENIMPEVNQLHLINLHLSAKKDLNKTMDDLCNELGLNKYVSEDDFSEEESRHGSHKMPRNNSVENCLNKMFEGLDNYAAFNPLLGLGSTPKEQVKLFTDIRTTPVLIPDENRLKSILKCRNDNNKKSQCDDNSFTTPRLETTRISFGSTKLNNSSLNESNRTPLSDKTNLLLTSGNSINNSNNIIRSPFQRTPAPMCSFDQESFYTPLRNSSKKSLSPGMVEVSPETKRTLLVGIACYVDVKTNKEDCSSSVALELLSMGANVEKTFNKKVTHVVFKEGRPSTYFRAKKLGVTMVSVLWLEACKRERRIVDASLYPPVGMEKYESLSPSDRKIPSLRTIQRKLRKHLLWEAGIQSADSKNKVRINWRKAITDIKIRHDHGSQESSQGRLCTKKLDFQSTDSNNLDVPCKSKDNRSQDSVIVISDSTESKQSHDDKRDSSGSSFDLQISPIERRNSAPARFVTERKKRKRKNELIEPPTESQNKYMTIDKLFAKQLVFNENKKFKVLNDENSSQCSQSRRKRLFNPEEAIVIIDTPDNKATPPPVTYDIPYKVDEEVPNSKNAQTRSTSLRKVFKKVATRKPLAKKSLTSLLEQDEANSSKNSLTYFVNSKKIETKMPKEPPTIVCTSLLPEEVRHVAYVVGKLGTFDIEQKVSSKTTHLITSAPRRTVNLLKALVRGAWILHYEWLLKSEEAGHWLNEEEFELKTFSHAVTEMRRERQAFGAAFCSELFSKSGPIYVSRSSIPSHKDLTELIRLCKGRIVSNSSSADFIIGGKILVGETAPRLKEKWILDSITQNTLLDTERYVIKINKS